MYNLLYIFKKFKNNTLFKCENCNNFRKLSNSIINKASIHNNLKKKYVNMNVNVNVIYVKKLYYLIMK